MAEQESSRLWAELQRHLGHENYDAAYSTCTKLLKHGPGDEDLHLVQLYCLIQLSQFDAALKLMDDSPQYNELTRLQRAYCQYRLHALDDALATLAKDVEGAEDPSHISLEAQVHYRREDFAKAVQLYSQLGWEENAEVSTNLSASYACAKAAANPLESDMPTFAGVEFTHEMCFNLGSHALAAGDYAAAEEYLEKSRNMCKNALREEGYDDADIEEELGVIKAQLSLVYQLTGRTGMAKDIYESILKTKPSDAALMAVVSNNLVALAGEKNIFESKQRLKATTGHGLEQKLAKYQKGVIAGNQALMYFHDKQSQQCEGALKAVAEMAPDSPLPALITAATLAKNKQFSEAIAELQGFMTKHLHANNDRVFLTIAQLCLSSKDWAGAIKALSSSAQLKYRPGVVSTLVALHEELGAADVQAASSEREAAAQLLRDAVHHAEQNSKGDLTELLSGQAEFFMAHDMFSDAADAFTKMLKHDPGNKRALAGLVMAYSHCDLQKAEQYAQQLPEISATLPVSMETLEAVVPGKRVVSKLDAAQPAADETKKKRKKRKGRKGKLPKDKDALIDPERWLPKWQRSYNRRKYKKQAQAQALRGPQGAAAASAPSQTGSLGQLKGKAPATSTPTSQSPPPAEQAAAQGSAKKNAQAKKKKKGKF